jgi:hypothetical protein
MTTNLVSTGRNPNLEPVCGTCPHFTHGGWCSHPTNRVPPMKGWPQGFTPSMSIHGGCDLHPDTNKGDVTP